MSSAIPGEPAAVEAAADELARAAAAMTEAGDSIGSHGRAVTANWTGTASEAGLERISFLGRRTRSGGEVMADMAPVLRDYAQELRQAQAAHAAGQQQLEAGQAALARLDTAGQPASESARQARDGAGRTAAAGRADMAAAVTRYETANAVAAKRIDALTAEFDGVMNPDIPGLGAASPSAAADTGAAGPGAPGTPAAGDGLTLSAPQWNDYVDWGNSLYTSAAKAGQQAAAFAADRAGWASAAATAAATRTNGFSRRAAAGALAREYVRQEASALDVSARNAARSARLPGADKLFRLSQVPLHATAPVLRSVPLVNVGVTLVGTGVDASGGMSLPHAAVKNVASTGASMAATGAVLTAAAAVGAVGAAPVLVAVGVGAAVGYGVGQAVEHWGDDVARAASSAADKVGDTAQEAADRVGQAATAARNTAGRLWGRLTG